MVAQYFGSWIGILWNVVFPSLVLVAYLAVFEFSPKFAFGGWNTVGGYGVNLIAALVPWMLFQEGVTRASNAYVEQRHLLTQIPVPAPLFPLANVASALFRHGVGLGVVAILLLSSGINTGAHWLALGYLIPLTLLLTASTALIVACLTVVNRDVAPAVAAGMLPFFFTTPVIYPPHYVPVPLRPIMDLNPLTPVVSAYRDVLVTGIIPPTEGLLWSAAVGVVLLGIGVVLVRHLGPELPERV